MMKKKVLIVMLTLVFWHFAVFQEWVQEIQRHIPKYKKDSQKVILLKEANKKIDKLLKSISPCIDYRKNKLSSAFYLTILEQISLSQELDICQKKLEELQKDYRFDQIDKDFSQLRLYSEKEITKALLPLFEIRRDGLRILNKLEEINREAYRLYLKRTKKLKLA